MARATQDVRVVRTETKHGVTLQLTQAEAETLYILLRHVSGSPEGRRRDTSSIHDALVQIGFFPTTDGSTSRHFIKLDPEYRGAGDIKFVSERLPL